MLEPDRRKYYRIDDIVGLKYSQVINSIQSLEQDCESPSITMPSLLDNLDTELGHISNALSHSQPTVAKALDIINRKVTLLASQVNETEELNNTTETRVNLSACGVAFYANEEVPTGSMLNITMVLRPSREPIFLKGRVISCEKQSNEIGAQYWLRVEYSDPDNTVKELLIQHVVKKEYTVIRTQRDAHQAVVNPLSRVNCI